ncbi:MAG: TraR/DksA C4-type zinc finger protein [Bdellovibrionales bacterium]|nr:TraR/DksA C4-type zinc finger protein [Bdellovibrionales bacterium]
MQLSNSFHEECRIRLIEAKRNLLEQLHNHRLDFNNRDFKGDEADLSTSVLQENQLLASQQRMRERLLDIEKALARLQMGTYGFCEETEEPIEPERLRALPWTSLSIEGAEIRESLTRKSRRA